MGLGQKLLERVEDFLKSIIIKYWYIDLTVTAIAFVILMIIEKMRKDKT